MAKRFIQFLWAATLILAANAGQAAGMGLEPFRMTWSPDGQGILADLSYLNEKPAGKDGFITVKDGRFALPDGRRWRIWGVNLTFSAVAPTKADAPGIARQLARFGINCVRLHHMDHPAPRGILAAGRPDSRQLDPDTMDRMDFFMNELKKQGIYVDINLNVARAYKAGDGVRDFDKLGYGKGATYFNPRLIELQKEFARALLAHRNPYTGAEYRNEPAVALVEIVNENSLVESWISGRLVGADEDKGNNPTWRAIPVSYDRELTALYNAWLKRTQSPETFAQIRQQAGVAEGAEIPRLAPAQFGKAGKLRFETEARFYIETENQFFADMQQLLKDELGVKAPVIGNSMHSKGTPSQAQLLSLARFDALDAHYYWNHPAKKRGPDGKGYETYVNQPMINKPEQSNVATVARSAMAGKPFIISEVNTPFPSDWLADGFPILTAYAAFQDWDGIFWFTFANDASWSQQQVAPRNFDIWQDPIKMPQVAAGALLFRRADVAPAREMVVRDYALEECYESLRLGWKDAPLYTPGYPELMSLAHGMRIGKLGVKQSEAASKPAAPARPVKSDTGELEWRVGQDGRGLVTIDAPRSQGLVGFVKGSGAEARNLAADVENEFCALMLAAMDEAPLARAERLLLTAGAKATLTGMEWNENRTIVKQWGKQPLLIEPVRGAVRLKGLQGAKGVEAQPLDGAGRALGTVIKAKRDGEAWKIELGAPTTWYAIRVMR